MVVRSTATNKGGSLRGVGSGAGGARSLRLGQCFWQGCVVVEGLGEVKNALLSGLQKQDLLTKVRRLPKVVLMLPVD